jgi:hypothetical protein
LTQACQLPLQRIDLSQSHPCLTPPQVLHNAFPISPLCVPHGQSPHDMQFYQVSDIQQVH